MVRGGGGGLSSLVCRVRRLARRRRGQAPVVLSILLGEIEIMEAVRLNLAQGEVFQFQWAREMVSEVR